ncbi:MAG TPA: lipopolysaccharide kinase InaA family protein [Planctomycetaceae bacterium]|nr:lipopolysaccharide kinase InaA family protein [Planctomycetaceae bacterium]
MSGRALSVERNRAGGQTAPGGHEFVVIESNGIEWTIRAELVDSLLSAIDIHSDGFAIGPFVEVVKHGPHRTVCRLSLPGGNFYIKHFRIAGARAFLQNLVRPSKAELEWRAARQIARLGLPTFDVAAVGMARRGGVVRDSFLISREIPGAVPLDQFVASELAVAREASGGRASIGRESALRQRLAASLGNLAARVHRAGVEQVDFHAANILVRLDQDGTPLLWLIDLHKVHFHRSLTSRRRLKNLSLLHQFFAGRSTRTDRLRFHRAYWRELCAPEPPPPTSQAEFTIGLRQFRAERAEIAVLEKSLTAAAVRGWQRADRAWKRGNRHVKKLGRLCGDCRGLATLDVAELEAMRDDPERRLSDGVLCWHKQTPKHRVAEIAFPHGKNGASRAVLKCVRRLERRSHWLSRFRMSPVRRAWEFGHALLRRGIDTPRPLMFVEQNESHFENGYLLTEVVREALNVREYCARIWPQMTPLAQRDWLRRHSGRLAVQLRLLHESGFEHRDLKFQNLMVSERHDDPRVYLLDLEGMRKWRRLPARRAAQNLARINVSAMAHGVASRSDRLRFLKLYLGRGFAGGWKSWWRRIAHISLVKQKTNQRRGRVIS